MSGEDFELSQRGIGHRIIRCLFGPQPLGIVYPDISKDVAGIVAKCAAQPPRPAP